MLIARVGLSIGIVAAGAAGTARAQIGPISVVQASTAVDSTDFKQVEVDCPPGTIAFAGGASITDHGFVVAGDIVVHQSHPLGDPPTSWLAAAQERSTYNANWELTSWALCATVEGYELVSVSTAFDSSSPKEVSAFCPAGMVPIGFGGAIFFFSPSLVLTALTEIGGGGRARARESPATSASWILNVKVGCAPGLDVESYRGDSWNGLEDGEDLAIYCPPDRLALGGGVELTNGRPSESRPLFPIGWYARGSRLIGDAQNPWELESVLQCYRP